MRKVNQRSVGTSRPAGVLRQSERLCPRCGLIRGGGGVRYASVLCQSCRLVEGDENIWDKK